jgi:hypothetical protein
MRESSAMPTLDFGQATVYHDARTIIRRREQTTKPCTFIGDERDESQRAERFIRW